MNENGRQLVEQSHREAVAWYRQQPAPPVVERRTIHYTELPEANPASPLQHEWNCYRRAVARLLAEGHAGRFVLIKGEVIVGIWNTEAEAETVGLQKYLLQPFLVHRIQEREPILRGPSVLWRCPSSSSRFSRTD
jgi:hypothetical protein